LSRIIKSRQVRVEGTKYLLPPTAEYLAKENQEFIKEDDIPIKYIEEPADEEQPEIRPTPEEIHKEAKAQAEEIIKQAKKKADEIREKAQKESEVLLRQVQDEAKEKGYSQGLDLGKEEGIKSWEGLFQKFDQKVSGLLDQSEKWKEDFPGQVIDLAIEIAKRIINEEVKGDPEIIVPRVRDTLKELAQVGDVLIKVSPEDYPLMDAAKEKIFAENGGLKKINLMANEELESGDFLIETQFGGIDGRVKTQLELLSEELKKRWRKNGRN